MSFSDFEKEKQIQKDLQDLLSSLKDDKVSFRDLVQRDEPSIESTPIFNNLVDKFLDDFEEPTISEPIVTEKTGNFFIAGGGGENNTISNVGGGIEIFKEKYGSDLRLRTLSATGSATVTQVGDLIVIGASTSSSPIDSWMEVSANYYTSNQIDSSLLNKADFSAINGFKFGTSSDFSKFDENTGFLSAVGSACAWDDLLAPATSINPAGSPAPPTVDNTDGSLIFTATNTNVVVIWFQLPHAWKVGSELRPHIHWYKKTDGIGYVNWQVKYKFAGLGGNFGNFTNLLDGTTQFSDSNSANVHAVTSFPVIDGSNLTISSMICIWLQRTTTSGDTYSGNAHLIGVDIHYLRDTQGSRDEYVK